MLMLDTHIVVALYQGKLAGLSSKALAAIDQEPLAMSPIVLLELELLHEIGRLRLGANPIADYLARELEVSVATERYAEVIAQALSLAYTRDPFDRLIVAHAALLKAPLLTLDETLHQHYARALS